MKPHIHPFSFQGRQAWECIAPNVAAVGFGYSPHAAYRNWRQRALIHFASERAAAIERARSRFYDEC